MSTIPEKFAITFEASHVPTLTAGSYIATSSLTVSGPVSSSFTSSELKLYVGGPRFSLSPNDIHGVFPPKDSTGEHENVLPHIELTRSTLPWERNANKGGKVLPWLALLLLQDDELLDPTKVISGKAEWTTLRDRLSLPAEPADHPDEGGKPFPPVSILKFDQAFLKSILPTASDLEWLTHVRMAAHPAHVEAVGTAERSVVICNRLPEPGSVATVHLVSLEGRFDNEVFTWPASNTDKVELLSLYSWQFSCPDTQEFKVSDRNIARVTDAALRSSLGSAFQNEEREVLYRGRPDFEQILTDKKLFDGLDDTEKNKRLSKLLETCHIQAETFKGLMDSLDVSLFKIATGERVPGQSFFELGSVPLAHGVRQGGKTASWYRGPLMAANNVGSTVELGLPVRSADQLLLFETGTKMFDVSYAAAWELGRLISVSEPSMSSKIAQWKTSHAREVAVLEQELAFSYIPFTDSSFAHVGGGELEQSLQNYFNDLSLLKGLPFQYLVPDEQLLPLESLRVFRIDPHWVEALLDGAFSIGRVTTLDTRRESSATAQPHTHHHNSRPELSGILLRSDLVSGWPSLMVEASNPEQEPSSLDVLRFERLSSEVLIVIFKGVLKSVDIHLPPEGMHFGFSRPTNEGDPYFKELKNPTDATEINSTQDVILRRGAESLRVLDTSAFGTAVARKIRNISHFASSHLAVELLEGVPRLRVSVSS